MIPAFGASMLSWISPVWTPENGLYAIRKTAAAGFDLMEILLPVSMDFDAATVKQQLAESGISARCSLNLPAHCHLPFYPKEATQLIKTALDKVAALETHFLGGVLHGAIGVFTGQPRTQTEEDIICEVWADVAEYARKSDITIGIEPINRYESYVCTSAAEVLTLIKRVGAPNLALHLDTFHMNIEETNFYDPVLAAGSLLQHVHITESNRGMPREGNVHWEDFFRALKDTGFSGALVLENFSTSVAGLAAPTSLWRRSAHNAEELATGSLRFMKDLALKYQL